MMSGCAKKTPPQTRYNENEVLKISVLKSGDVLAESAKVSMQDLDSMVASNAVKNGVVWYYRESGQEKPPPQAMEVLDVVVKYKRPISMSSKADFSDTIDKDGRSIPRKN
jgi:hypothetical protein